MKKTCEAVVCMLIVFCLALSPLVSADWSIFRSDPSYNGQGSENPEATSVLTPTQLWKTNFTWTMTEGGKTRDLIAPTVVDGVVYFGARSYISIDCYHSYTWINVYALDASNGAEIWNYEDNDSYAISSPVVVNGVVYFKTNGYIRAVNAYNGDLLWNYPAGMCNSNPVVVQDRLFVGSGNTMLALNTINGHCIWNYTADQVFFSPSVVNGVVYVGSANWYIYAFNARTGDKIWSYYAGDILEVPSVANGVVYASLVGGNILALDAGTGTKIWNFSYFSNISTSNPNLAIMKDVLYVRVSPDKLYALNAVSGTKIWVTTFGQEISNPTFVNDNIYLGSDNALYALNASNGEILWNYTEGTGFGSLIVDNGVAYVNSLYGNEDNQIYAIAIPSLPSGALQKELFPIVPVVAISVAVVIMVAGLLVYFKKRK